MKEHTGRLIIGNLHIRTPDGYKTKGAIKNRQRLIYNAIGRLDYLIASHNDLLQSTVALLVGDFNLTKPGVQRKASADPEARKPPPLAAPGFPLGVAENFGGPPCSENPPLVAPCFPLVSLVFP